MNLINKYEIKVRFIFSDPSLQSFELHKNNIIKVSGLKDYKNFLPITYLEVMVSEKDYYYLIYYKQFLKINLKVDTYLVEEIEEYISIKQPYTSNTILNYNFRPYFEDVTPFKDRELLENPNNFFTEESGELRPLQLYLFLDDNLDVNKNINNFIINQDNVFNSILYMCQKNKVENLIMQQPDNQKVFNQIICPPLTIKKALDYFQEVYGIYDRSLMTFNDYNRLYILPRYITQAVVEENECKKIVFLINKQKASRAMMTNNCEYKEKEKTYYINALDNLDIIDYNILEKELTGDINKIIAIDSTFAASQNKEKVEIKGYENKEKDTFIIDDKDNPHLLKSYKFDKECSQVRISFNVMNVDITFITPNKEYIMVFEDEDLHSKYSGHYRLDKFSYNIARAENGTQDLQASCKFVLYKIKTE